MGGRFRRRARRSRCDGCRRRGGVARGEGLAAAVSLTREERPMVIAHFMLNEELRETREVSGQWLQKACANRENVLLNDGNTYEIVDGRYREEGPRTHARVAIVAPRFARGG